MTTHTQAEIDQRLYNVGYHVFPGTTVTVCCLTLTDGTNVIGKSEAVSEGSFDPEAERLRAFVAAIDAVWVLEPAPAPVAESAPLAEPAPAAS